MANSMACKWTKADVETLRKNYGELGIYGCAKLLPNHSTNSISNKAFKIGLRSKRAVNLWTTGEIKTLRKNYGNLGAKGCAKLITRHSEGSIGSKAAEIGLHSFAAGHRWTLDEESKIADAVRDLAEVFDTQPKNVAYHIRMMSQDGVFAEG